MKKLILLSLMITGCNHFTFIIATPPPPPKLGPNLAASHDKALNDAINASIIKQER